MADKALIEYALKKLEINQTGLAKQLGVTKAMVGRWKSGKDSIPYERQQQIEQLADIDYDCNPEFALWCGSAESARQWVSVLSTMYEYACEDYPFGRPLFEDDICLAIGVQSIALKLIELGANFPKTPPAIMSEDDDDYFDWSGIADLEREPWGDLLREIMENWSIYYGWLYAFVYCPHSDSNDFECGDNIMNLESQCANFAIYALDESVLSKFGISSDDVEKAKRDDIRKWVNPDLTAVCRWANKNRVSLRHDPADFKTKSVGALLQDCEADRWGFDEHIEGSIHTPFERDTKEQIEALQAMVIELHRKVDLLLAKDQ